MDKPDQIRRGIARRARELRQQHHWSQAQLAGKLSLSQSRLSEVERGAGSFTAEQFIQLLELFNVQVDEFVPRDVRDEDQLQNALSRFGATHLREVQATPTDRFSRLDEVVRAALTSGSSRFVTALAPVLVENADRVSLEKIHTILVDIGFGHRSAWLLDNTVLALTTVLADRLTSEWSRSYRRADLLLRNVQAHAHRQSRPELPDVLDSSLRTQRGVNAAIEERSKISERWNIVTSIQPADFVDALKESRVTHR